MVLEGLRLRPVRAARPRPLRRRYHCGNTFDLPSGGQLEAAPKCCRRCSFGSNPSIPT